MSDTPDEPIDPRTLPAEPVACSLGTWTHSDVDAGGNVYLIATPTGATIAIRANGELSAANLESDIANPAPAPVPVPSRVTRRQLFLALIAINPALTRDALRSQLAAESARIEFDEDLEFHRAHPLVASLATTLGLDADDVFRAAAQL